MIPVVEDYLSELIENKLSSLKSNPNQIDTILSGDANKLQSLKTFLSTKDVSVKRGYPRTPAELPTICILLSNEEETQDGLGDYGEDEDSDILQTTQSVTVISKPNALLPLPYAQLPNYPVYEVQEVVNNDLGITLDPSEYVLQNPDLGLLEIISGNVDDGDTLTVTFSYRNSATINTEVMFEENFRLEVWTNNGDLTVQLYHLLKWMLISGRSDLITEWDIFRQRVSGTDFDPVPNWFPEFVYRRALNFWCQVIVSTPSDTTGYITDVSVNQSVSVDINGGE